MLLGIDPRIGVLEIELARVRQEFERAIDVVPADRLHKAPAGQWTPAQLIWHIAKVERGVARMIERLDAGLPVNSTVPPGPSTSKILALLDKDDFKDRTRKLEAPEPIRPPGEVDLVAERARWADGRAQLIAAIRNAGPRLSLMRHPHPFFGSYDGWQWTLMVARHEERHLLQLHEVVASTA